MESLWAAGARVQAYDPVAMAEARRLYPKQVAEGALQLCDRAMRAAERASALCIVTEWQEFRSPDFEGLKAALEQPLVIDGRNLYDPQAMQRAGFRYFGIGRGESVLRSARS
jgi:UDPglucose 6-dehydrogenase